MKKTNLISLIAFIVTQVMNAQNISNDNQSSIEFNFGRNIHGSGDISGYQYGFVYTDVISNRFYWFLGFEGTLNDDADFPLTFEDTEGNVFDSTLHTVIAGFQLAGGIRYNIFQNKNHNFGISVGPVFRYQASSLNDDVSTLFPVITMLPAPVRIIINNEPARTFAVGGTLRLHYSYKINNKSFISIHGGFQGDTNGDTIPNLSLGFGKSF